ncbi:hypothetical protein ACFWBI_10825 [Streptomyces sp. NPDC059982]|uniref:hypothetical protein n=1 Tax=unclassified Streptomyces TaxID=2593676 RepID=UPI00343DD291
MKVATDAATRHPRVTGMLRTFGAQLNAAAPDSTLTGTWTQYARDTRRTTA